MQVRRRFRRLKRFAYLGAATGTVIAVRRARARRGAVPSVGPTATWPPLQVSDEPVAAVGDLARDPVGSVIEGRPEPAAVEGQNDGEPWVAAVDGACPVSHPIKANTNSNIYHSPGGRFYERTRAERCYSDPAAAEADGYRAAKGS